MKIACWHHFKNKISDAALAIRSADVKSNSKVKDKLIKVVIQTMINWEDHVTGLIRIQDKCLNFDVDHEEIRVRLSDAMFLSEIGHVNKHHGHGNIKYL